MSPWQRGERIKLAPQPDAVHLFDAATGDRLP
jgi:multiple sugar transport system ATP-binding protein